MQQILRPKTKASDRIERRLEGDEEQRLLNAAEAIEAEGCEMARTHGSAPPLPLPALIRLAVATGLRRSKLVNIQYSDLDLNARTLHVRDTKNGESRTAALSTTAVKIIEQQPRRADGRLWPPMHPSSITRAMNKACKRADITDLRFHDLRHEATSRFFELGLDATEVASITGHKSMAMLNHYTHHKPERLAAKLG